MLFQEMQKNISNSKLPQDLIEKIKSISSGFFNLNKNELLFKEGDITKYIYFIEKGDVALKKIKNKSEIDFLHLSNNELIGIDSVYIEGYCNYSAFTSTSTRGLKILITDFIELITEHKVASLELMKYLSSILNRIENNI
jgi:CRP-like cAMP-binding protein